MSSTPYKGTSAHADCDPDVCLYLDGVAVPVVDVADTDLPAAETRITTDGAANITRTSKVYVPIEWYDEEVEPVTRILRKDPQSAPNARLELMNKAGDYHTVHDGFVRTIGPTEGECVAITVGDYAEFFNSVGFSGTYGTEGSVNGGKIARDAIETVTENVESIDEVALVTDVKQFTPNAIDQLTSASKEKVGIQLTRPGILVAVEEYLGIDTGIDDLNVIQSQSFKRNRDTAATALDWICDRADARWWIDYNDEVGRRELYIDSAPENYAFTDVRIDEEESAVNGKPIVVTKNNAAFQLSPMHTLQGKGARPWRNQLPTSNEYPVATVQHDGLVGLVGENTQPPRREFDTNTVDETVGRTITELQRHIEEAAGGEIITRPEPDVLPYNIVEAKPVCDARVLADLPPITYQINQVIHHVEANDPASADQPATQTVLRCGISAERGDFSVVEQGVREL